MRSQIRSFWARGYKMLKGKDKSFPPETLFANTTGLYARTKSHVGLPTWAIFLAYWITVTQLYLADCLFSKMKSHQWSYINTTGLV